MKKIVAAIAGVVLAAGCFAAGYTHCYLRVLREAEFYLDGEMIIVVMDGEYNETFFAGEWNPAKFVN